MAFPGSVPITFVYKHIGDHQPVHLDVYSPNLTSRSDEVPLVPAVVYFHAGGMTVGNRTSWFPSWLQRRSNEAGYAFVSADYRLIPPSTGHSVVEDIVDLFTFISKDLDKRLEETRAAADGNIPQYHVDKDNLAVAGHSAGGLCAYLAVKHVSPKPKALLAMYAMGGNLLTDAYLAPKSKPFFRGFELCNPVRFAEYLHPSTPSLPPDTVSSAGTAFKDLPETADSALSYHGSDSSTPGWPSNPRMYLVRLYLQLGNFLDYWTGEHEPSISERFRVLLANASDDEGTEAVQRQTRLFQEIIPEQHQAIFPQLGIDSSWPPSFLVHGGADTAVVPGESENMSSLLRAAGVPVQLTIIDGQDHSFDYQANAETKFESLFTSAMEFLKTNLSSPRN